MDENHTPYFDDEYHDHDPKPDRNKAMATAALAFAILSVLSCLIFYVSIPLGSISIILALLSRADAPLEKRARAALITAIAGCVISAVLTLSAVFMMYTNPALRRQAEALIDLYTRQEEGRLSDYYLNSENESVSVKENNPSVIGRQADDTDHKADDQDQQPADADQSSESKIQKSIAEESPAVSRDAAASDSDDTNKETESKPKVMLHIAGGGTGS